MKKKVSNKDVIRKWVTAYNERDARIAADLYHPKAINIQVAVGAPLKGRDAIYRQLVDFFASIPDNYTRIENLFEDGNWVVLEWTGGGTFYKTARSRGKKFTFEGCGFFRIRNGKILFQRGYWDMKKWERVTR